MNTNRFGKVDISKAELNFTSPFNYFLKETKVDNIDILTLLEQQQENFPALYNYVKGKNISPSIIFLPQTLKQIDAEFSIHQELLYECLTYLDIVKTYSFITYNDTNFFTENIKKIIVENRTVLQHANCIAKDTIDDFIFSNQNEAYEFLENNKTILAIHIFSLVFLIFYTTEE